MQEQGQGQGQGQEQEQERGQEKELPAVDLVNQSCKPRSQILAHRIPLGPHGHRWSCSGAEDRGLTEDIGLTEDRGLT